MQPIFNHIEKQLAYNAGKNILCTENHSTFRFIDTPDAVIQALAGADEPHIEELLTFAVERALDQFYQVNQYYTFDQPARTELKHIYRSLFAAIKAAVLANKHQDMDSIAQQHYNSLQQWLRKSNLFAQKLYPDTEPFILRQIVCAEYTPATQMDILAIRLPALAGPIIDVGCGKNAALVRYLQNKGFQAFGIDRSVAPEHDLIQSDWFNFTFQPGQWGTIISHLGFSNHFVHHHFRQNGDYIAYARKYMEVLHSLKRGGSFYYAPDLPFIEPYLDPAAFTIHQYTIAGTTYKATQITVNI